MTARLDGFAAGATVLTAAADATADFRLDIAPLSDTVVVTASRTAEGSASVMESHSVFTADDIEALGSHSVADVLRYVPGLNIESTGREGQLASVFARGGESDYNHVLIDGVRVNANGGHYDFRPRVGQRDRAGRGRAGRAVGAVRIGRDGVRRPDLHEAGGRRTAGPDWPARSREARSGPCAETCACSAAPSNASTTSSGSPTAEPTARFRTA